MPRNISLDSLSDQIKAVKDAILKHKKHLTELEDRDKQEKERLERKRALEIGMIALSAGLFSVSDGEFEKLFLSFAEKVSIPPVQTL